MIWIIGGTRETRALLDRIKDIDNIIVSIATKAGREFVDWGNLVVGRMNYQKMRGFVKDENISLVVDLSHPYAIEVTENAEKVSNELGISYIRYDRPKAKIKDNAIYVKSYKECYNLLKGIKGRVLITTGSKNLGNFEEVRGDNRFIYRVLPTVESMDICNREGISMKDIVAVLGPFSKEYNKAMLREYKADYCIMKDSGREGGTLEKLGACRELSITPIIIGRGQETRAESIEDVDKIEEIIRKHI